MRGLAGLTLFLVLVVVSFDNTNANKACKELQKKLVVGTTEVVAKDICKDTKKFDKWEPADMAEFACFIDLYNNKFPKGSKPVWAEFMKKDAKTGNWTMKKSKIVLNGPGGWNRFKGKSSSDCTVFSRGYYTIPCTEKAFDICMKK